MLGTAINRSWQQLLHPRFRSVFLTAVIAATVTLLLLLYGVNLYWPDNFTFDSWWLSWLNDYSEYISSAGFWFVAGAGSYILFPAIVTLVMGLLTDRIADAVEDEYYPNRKGSRAVPYGDIIVSASKLALLMILLNIIFLVPYIMLLIAGGFGFIILFISVNGFLLGREYFEMVAIRHMDRRNMHLFRKQHASSLFMGGAVIAGMFMVPFLNILAPIIGAALMTHIFHHLDARPATKVRG